MDLAADRAGKQFAEVVVGAAFAPLEHGFANLIAGVVRGSAAIAGRVEAIEPAGGLHLTHAIGAGRQAGELVVALGVCCDRDAGGIAVGVEQFDHHAADARLAGIKNTVVIGVVVDVARERDGNVFAKVVVYRFGP